ncbi:MAG: TonB-dependent receptor [Pseudomonadota bacterium]
MTRNNATQRAVPKARPVFSLTPLAALLAATFMAGAPAQAADDPQVAELRQEIARLRQALNESERARGVPAAEPAPAATAPVVAAAPQPAADEPDRLGEVTVRGRNRIELLQDVPVSVSVVSGKELEREGATDLDAITKRASNVSWSPGNARTSSISLRGLGKQSQTDAMDPSVGIVVDGLAYSYNPLASFDFIDVEAVEVNRGPQGTLAGKNANLGVINITTKRPSFTPDSSYALTLGEDQRVTARAAIGGPVIDGLLAWRGTFLVDRGRGYVKNGYDGESPYGNHDRISGRVQFLLTPSKDFNARLAIELAPQTGESFNAKSIQTQTPAFYANGSPNTFSTDASTRLARRWFKQHAGYSYSGNYLDGGGHNEVNVDAQTPTLTDTKGIAAELNWNLGRHKLTSITGYKDMRFRVRNDDGTPFDISKRGGGHLDKFTQLSTELRLASGLGGAVDYQGGVYLLATKNAYDSAKGFGSDAGAWFATNSQYNTLDTDGNGRYLLGNSLEGLLTVPLQKIRNRSGALFAQANWHPSDPLTVTAGLRLTRENRRNTTNNRLAENGYGTELNPVSVNNVQLGGFASNAAGALTSTDPAQVAVANSVAQKYFNTPTYAALTNAQRSQVAAAKAIRRTNIGVLWDDLAAQPFRDTQPSAVLSPSYRFSDDLTSYVSWQYGEKSGISQNTNGVTNPIRPEKASSFEWGVKSAWFDKSLILNADVFVTNIKDYQQAVQVFDVYTTAANADGTNYYTSATGNVAKVRVKGLEVDATYSGIKNTSIRFAGAYNDAVYKDFQNSGQPFENGYNGAPKYRDVSGQNLPGASKISFSLGAEHRLPVWGGKEFHASFNTAFIGRANSDIALSSYGWIPSHSITDLSIGIGRVDQTFDVSLVAKNVFNDQTPLGRTWNTYIPAPPRWLGVMFSGKL